MMKTIGRSILKNRTIKLKIIRISTVILNLALISSGWSAGRSGFPVLNTIMDARSLALAGANLTDLEQPNSISVNPASAAGGSNLGSASFAKHALDMWSGRLNASYQLSNDLVIGCNLSTFDYGDFDYSLRESGATGKTFQASEHVLSGNISGWLSKSIAWGASLKLSLGSLEESLAGGISADIGLIWDAYPGRTRFAAVIRNAGSQINGYAEERDPMPTELLLSASNKLEHLPLTLHFSTGFVRYGDGDYNLNWMPGKTGLNFSAGGEFEIFTEGAVKPFHVRLGYCSQGAGQRIENRLDTLAGFSFGLGFEIKRFNLDYSYVPMGALGDVHRIGISRRI